MESGKVFITLLAACIFAMYYLCVDAGCNFAVHSYVPQKETNHDRTTCELDGTVPADALFKDLGASRGPAFP